MKTKKVTKRATRRTMKQKIRATIKDSIILGTIIFTPFVAMFFTWLAFGY